MTSSTKYYKEATICAEWDKRCKGGETGTQEDGVSIFHTQCSVFHSLTLSSISCSKNFVYLIFKGRLFIRVYLLCILMSPFQKCLSYQCQILQILPLVKIKIAPVRYTHGGLVAKSNPTLATPWTVACQDPLSMGFSRKEYWSGLPFPSPENLPDPGIECGSPALQAVSLLTELQGKLGNTQVEPFISGGEEMLYRDLLEISSGEGDGTPL